MIFLKYIIIIQKMFVNNNFGNNYIKYYNLYYFNIKNPYEIIYEIPKLERN